ncbi:MAG: hypothetical protein IPM04_14275 [Saprospiraceae bacterium]|nr:hypothetical protein [Candidatus Brachybacter algidus]MBK8748952.1 hypothetical protein [Candidatus Brachybacter algidus]
MAPDTGLQDKVTAGLVIKLPDTGPAFPAHPGGVGGGGGLAHPFYCRS